MSSALTFASPAEALAMPRSAMGYLVAADPTEMAADAQAQTLAGLEQLDAMQAAARASILGTFAGAKVRA